MHVFYYLDGVVKCCQSFTLSEIIDVAWGLLRLYIETNQSSSINSSTVSPDHSYNSVSEIVSSGDGIKMNFLSDNRMFTILQQIEVLVTANAYSLKHLRPYVNGELF